MKVGMYYNNSDVRVEYLPVPVIGPRDILIKVKASGICGSDIMEWYRIKRAPLVLGHEVTGEVAEVGENIKKFKQGDHVFAIHHVPCDECVYCLNGHQTACLDFQGINNFDPGGFSEYLKVSGKSVDTGVLKLPDHISYEEGTFIEPLGTVLRGTRSLGVNPGDSVVVIGSGLAGLLYIKTLRALGAGNIIAVDVHNYRLETAKQFGATHTVRSSPDLHDFIRNVNGGRLADKVVICAGAISAVSAALQSVDRGGTVLFFAVPKPGETVDIDFNPFWRNDIVIKTSYGSAPVDHMQALELLKAGTVNLSDMVTHRFPLEKIADGFNLASDGNDCLKVLIIMNE